MRVTIVHNESAGRESYETRDLVAVMHDCGHKARAVLSEDANIRAAIRRSPDAIVVAGGDGTVAKVAIAMHQTGAAMPMFILPAGTSNNIATSLDLSADVPGLVLALADATAARLDIGEACGPWGREHFVEGAGVGFIGTMLARESTIRGRVTRAQRAVKAALHIERRDDQAEHGVARLVREERARRFRVQADGEELSGAYIAIEVMNIRRIGPRIELAPSADTRDGLLDLVLVRDEDREALADYVESGSSNGRPPGITRRVRRAHVSWPGNGGHVDDEVWPQAQQGEAGDVTIEIVGSVPLLLPRSLMPAV